LYLPTYLPTYVGSFQYGRCATYEPTMPNLYLPNFALILTLREWELDSRGVVAGGTTIAAGTTTTSLAGAVAYQKASQSNAASLPIYHLPGESPWICHGKCGRGGGHALRSTNDLAFHCTTF
jgi:hypothetical protein